ncbi:hypothetical protein EMIT0P176_140123 [Pseudomonas sp. IT-P176]
MPASVRAMRRVVRLSRRVCRWASRLETARETLAVVVSSCTAAAVKLPASATQLKARMFCKVSMGSSQGRWQIVTRSYKVQAFNQGIISLTVTKIHKIPSLSPRRPSPRIVSIGNLPLLRNLQQCRVASTES